MPKWKRKKAKEAKSRKPQNKEDGLQRFNGLGLDEKRHLRVRTLGHFSFWRKYTAKTEII
jgi:hypothetical protein